ncbi:helix-turn-helix domain-containing protein [Pseudoalteromonas sp. Bsw20308]|uniref:helix-turn-helix domain-containing protein n=1 Tax=Pseudoalteromonas sp. Bsw20308 TaxID=283699 RepID=UPI000517DFE0|nr:helix-turn-helix transcriptional regulator [Pseudoalteromonas sp. Bsw20308]
MKTYKEQFGRNLKELRLNAELSQEELADLCSLHRTYIGSVERGERNISLNNIILISQALNTSPSILFKGIK